MSPQAWRSGIGGGLCGWALALVGGAALWGAEWAALAALAVGTAGAVILWG